MQLEGRGRGAETATERGATTLGGAAEAADTMSLARAGHYLLLGHLLARAPSVDLLSRIANLKGDASPLGMARLALSDAARSADHTEVQREYFDLFVGVGRGEILPYASYYLTGFLNERPLARLREDMARFGIARRTGVFESEDHISSLMEIMAGVLSGSFGAPEQAADEIFSRHIEPWAPRLMADISRASTAKFYRSVAGFGAAWLEIEAQAMRLPE